MARRTQYPDALVRKYLTDTLLQLGILRRNPKKKTATPGPSSPLTGGYGRGDGAFTGGYGHSLFIPSKEQLATPTKHWGFSIKKAMKANREAFKVSRTAFKPSFRKYLRG